MGGSSAFQAAAPGLFAESHVFAWQWLHMLSCVSLGCTYVRKGRLPKTCWCLGKEGKTLKNHPPGGTTWVHSMFHSLPSARTIAVVFLVSPTNLKLTGTSSKQGTKAPMILLAISGGSSRWKIGSHGFGFSLQGEQAENKTPLFGKGNLRETFQAIPRKKKKKKKNTRDLEWECITRLGPNCLKHYPWSFEEVGLGCPSQV